MKCTIYIYQRLIAFKGRKHISVCSHW